MAPAIAQGGIRDTAIPLTAVTLNYAFQLPSMELYERFGWNNNVGLSVGVKTASNYMFGMEVGFIFGNNVIEPGLLRNVRNTYGEILDQEGQVAQVLIYQRGYQLIAYAAKIINVAGPNPNSGLLLKAGGGYLRHKIRIETQNNVVPQLEDENLEGYDRLCAGPAALFFAGYQHFGNNRLINFQVGFEMLVAFTKPLRAFNFDTEQFTSDTRMDALNGLRFGWTVPIYKRKAERFFTH
ncbi:MAG: hypothetical protein JNM31_03920 [Flavobacteriales bacterium]|nr:hypothetical protein [Flavobacteriales bacterium]